VLSAALSFSVWLKAALSKPRRALLIELERLVASECRVQGTSHACSLWGLEGVAGRPMRNVKVPTVPDTMSDFDFRWLSYRFGFSDLRIFEALDKVLTHLETKYGVKLG
jgi:hypothetical protein